MKPEQTIEQESNSQNNPLSAEIEPCFYSEGNPYIRKIIKPTNCGWCCWCVIIGELCCVLCFISQWQ